MTARIAVLGAGSIGCWVGGAWAASGLEVTLIGRERIGREIGEHGLTLSDHTGWTKRIAPEQICFSIDPAALAEAQIIALCVKSRDTEAAARQIAKHAKRAPAVLSFQNGIANVDLLRSALPKLEIVQGVVPFNVAHLGTGRWHKGTSGELILADTERSRALAAAVANGPGKLRLERDMPAIAWGKLLINLNNAVNALSGETLLDQLGRRDYRRVVAASIVEALDILAAAGIQPAQIGPIPPKLLPHVIAAPDFVFRNMVLKVQKIDPHARSSMADDLASGRETEIDYLNGEVVKLAQRIGREAPVNAAIVSLIKQRELGVERLWSPDELRKYVLEGHRGVALFGY
jgi:2-dehydropantoate 2-reductase